MRTKEELIDRRAELRKQYYPFMGNFEKSILDARIDEINQALEPSAKELEAMEDRKIIEIAEQKHIIGYGSNEDRFSGYYCEIHQESIRGKVPQHLREEHTDFVKEVLGGNQ